MQAINLDKNISVKIRYRKLILPSDCGLADGDMLVVTRYLHAQSNLALYTKEQFRNVMEALYPASTSESLASKIEAIRRFVIGNAAECIVEDGKISIPPHLMKDAGLHREAIWIQRNKGIEICSPESVVSGNFANIVV